MFDFHFVYADGNTYDVENVTKLVTFSTNGPVEHTGDQILNVNIPLKVMCLHSAKGNVTVSGENLIVIDVLKQES